MEEKEKIIIAMSKAEDLIVSVSVDGLNAVVQFIPPVADGVRLTQQQILEVIAQVGVTTGIDQEILAQIGTTREYKRPYLLATGKAPNHGTNGSLTFHFDTEKKSPRPKMLEDGKIDYRNLDLIEMVEEHGLLVSIVPPTSGTDGIDVYGNTLKAIQGKPAPKLPKGKNTYISQDEQQLLAAVCGHVIYTNGKVNISSVLDIATDVSTTTGNIDFIGSVLVRGNVFTGFSIRAAGSIEVFGVVEGAHLYAEENILIRGGIQGLEKATIEAKGTVTAKFIESAKVIAGGNIIAGNVVHSEIKCFDNLELIGKRAVLVGGNITVKNSVIARTIGSPMATITEIKIGNDPDLLEKYHQLESELQNRMDEYNKTTQVIESLTSLLKQNKLNNERKEQLVRVMNTNVYLREQIANIRKELDQLSIMMANHNGSIQAIEKIYSGTRVYIGNAIMFIRDELKSSKLSNINGRIFIQNL